MPIFVSSLLIGSAKGCAGVELTFSLSASGFGLGFLRRLRLLGFPTFIILPCLMSIVFISFTSWSRWTNSWSTQTFYNNHEIVLIKYSKQISESKHETWNKLQGLIPLDLRFLRQLMILDLLYFSGYEVKIRVSKGYPQPVMATQNRHLNDYIVMYSWYFYWLRSRATCVSIPPQTRLLLTTVRTVRPKQTILPKNPVYECSFIPFIYSDVKFI